MSNEILATAQRVAVNVDGLAQDLYHGRLQAIAVAAIRADGAPVYFYFDGTEQDRETLIPVINQLVGMYAERKAFAGNAPANNRSYGTH